MTSILKEAAMQRLIALTKRIVAKNMARIDEIVGSSEVKAKPRKSMDTERIARSAEAKQRFQKGMKWK